MKRNAAVRFLKTAFEPDDCVAILLKSYTGKPTIQRVGPVTWLQSARCQAWLRAMNANRYNVFIGINAIASGLRRRTREAIGAVRHVFLDADHDGPAVLSLIRARTDLPDPSYVLHSSPGRVHVFWRVTGFDRTSAEQLQRRLARELRTDLAATPITQTTRLPGFFNHKRAQPHLVSVDYWDGNTRYTPDNFPAGDDSRRWSAVSEPTVALGIVGSTERARRYLASVPPAIAGQHGDVHTFRVCCRIVRGFALSEEQALEVLFEWNGRCQPPWSFDELLNKVRCAKRYGREPVGGLL